MVRITKKTPRSTGFSQMTRRPRFLGTSCSGTFHFRRTGGTGARVIAAGVTPSSTSPWVAVAFPGSRRSTICRQYVRSLTVSTTELIHSQYSGLDWSARSKRVSRSRARWRCPWRTASIASWNITFSAIIPTRCSVRPDYFGKVVGNGTPKALSRLCYTDFKLIMKPGQSTQYSHETFE